ncbi:uncharacterized protein LOC141622495 [Silene latifolia]|uniref:uncharacterized protein LOC141622495 n=1 Tax=Silene latifolia TaxID=37657 RepID=UPI003D78B0B3
MDEDLIKYRVSRPRRPFLCLTRSITIFTTLIFITMFISLRIDDSTCTNFMQLWTSPRDFIPLIKLQNTTINILPLSLQTNPTHESSNIENLTENSSLPPQTCLEKNVTITHETAKKWEIIEWVSVELEPNYSSNLLARWLAPGGEPCKDSQTNEIEFLNIDDKKIISLSTGIVHEIYFRALDGQGNPHCQGGDYFEIDIAGESWKSRPPLRDYDNGTYSFTLQVEPHYTGNYTLRIILLFNHFKGLSFSPTRFAIDKQLRNLQIIFTWTESKLPELEKCRKSDFMRGIWAGRWTRHGRNDTCEIDEDGRYRCLDSNYPCSNPWCHGSLGVLESNGWVYSAHCSFKLFLGFDAWNCLNKRWIFLWGDSNHIDTIRNVMFFILDVAIPPISRRFDLNITNPRDESQWVRITNVFNGHWDDKSNYLGLNSLSNEGYRNQLKDYFSGTVVPDIVLFNSGLHDGVHWPNIRRFIRGAEYAANFWKEVIEGVKKRGQNVPNFIFRSTITAGGYARTLAFNPNKIEAFNGVLLEKMRATGIVTGIIDSFDMTWAWHYDNRCNDGVHYGRFPAKLKWRDGEIGHQYFVDLMLGHVLLNAICDS